MAQLEFTGECFIPGRTSKRLDQDHLTRYLFASQFVDGKNVLDIACGSGYGSRELLDAGAVTVDGVDLSEDAIEFANNNFGCDGVDYRCDSIYTYCSDKPYDVIVSFETIEHVDDYQKALTNLYRLLADDGVLLISSPNRFITSPKADSLTDKPANPYHVMEFNRTEFIAALRDAGFIVDEAKIYGQRLQPRIENKSLRKFYRKLFRPHLFKDPAVTPVGDKEPRYFLAVAKKK